MLRASACALPHERAVKVAEAALLLLLLLLLRCVCHGRVAAPFVDNANAFTGNHAGSAVMRSRKLCHRQRLKEAAERLTFPARSMSSTPADAPEHCPGTDSADAGKASSCEGCPNQKICATAPKGPDPDIELIRKRMSSIKKKVDRICMIEQEDTCSGCFFAMCC